MKLTKKDVLNATAFLISPNGEVKDTQLETEYHIYHKLKEGRFTIRKIELPSEYFDEMSEGKRTQADMLAVIHCYGQNNVSRSEMRSVHIGDLILYCDDFYVVSPVGFHWVEFQDLFKTTIQKLFSTNHEREKCLFNS